MSYLLDTNVISEPLKPKPDLKVKEWFSSTPTDAMYASVLSFGEIRSGIANLGDGSRKAKLISWLENDLSDWFGNRVMAIDLEIADRWGYLLGQHKQIQAVDALLAATALVHNLVLVTRNIKHFNMLGLEVINPWE